MKNPENKKWKKSKKVEGRKNENKKIEKSIRKKKMKNPENKKWKIKKKYTKGKEIKNPGNKNWKKVEGRITLKILKINTEKLEKSRRQEKMTTKT